MPYLRFGNLELAATGGVAEFSETIGYTFAEQAIATGKPISQAMGETLSEISLTVMLRAQLGHNVAETLGILNTMLKAGRPERLVFANGTYQGDYLISSLGTSVLHTSSTGEILAADLSVTLLEYADRIIISEKNTETKPSGAKTTRTVKEK